MQHIGSYIMAGFAGLLFLWMAAMVLADFISAVFLEWEQRQPKCPCGCGLTVHRARQLDKAH